jgi:hypothetical protein
LGRVFNEETIRERCWWLEVGLLNFSSWDYAGEKREREREMYRS